MVPGAADRLDIGRNRPSKSEGRRTLPQQSPNGCLDQLSPYLARPGQYFGEVNMKEELTYVGIDIAKGARGCRHPPVRPELEPALR